jgi:p-cumate 2,3-dioxygenase subunit alpha
LAKNSEPILDDLIVDDPDNCVFRVDRRAFTDPAILDAEKKLIFDQCWLYVGHESEIPDPGCFIKRKVAGRPVIFVRDNTGEVRIFFDACTHRGNSICRGSRGKTDQFTCFYHGWSFNTRGELRAVPDKEGYGKNFDRSKLSLGAPPRMDSYRGLVFLSMKPDIMDLKSYLGGTLPYIDDMLDTSDSEAVIAPGQQSYGIKTNWKLLMENSADAYHAPFTHNRFFRGFLTDIGADVAAWGRIAQGSADNRIITFENGHSMIDTPIGPLPLFADRPELIDDVRAKLTEKYGAKRASDLLDRSRNLLIFPNLILISAWRTIRTFYPVAPDDLEVEAWSIVGEDDSPALKEARFGNFISFLGPAGFGTPDDVEALEFCQEGFAAREVQWTDLSKGLGREGGSVANDELQMRTLWRQWYSMLKPDFVPGVEPGLTKSDDG